MNQPVTEFKLAKDVYDVSEGVTDGAVDRLVKRMRRHGLIEQMLQQRARYLLEWAKRLKRSEAFSAASPDVVTVKPNEALFIVQTGQAGPTAGPALLTREELLALLDQPLVSGIRIRHARRADLLAHAEYLEKQAAGNLHNARVARAIMTWLGNGEETVEESLGRYDRTVAS